jgi:hypothetical protein
MLFYKAWIDTRWRFLIGLAVLLFAAAVFVYARGELVRQMTTISEARGIAGPDLSVDDYRDYVWRVGIRDAIRQLTALFAVVLGAGGLLAQASRSGGGGLFMLSLPVSRDQLLGIRVAVGLAQCAALAFLPPLVITALSPAIGQSYDLTDALVHGLCLFAGGSVLFAATTLLSTMFNDVWRPPLLALCGVVVIGFVMFLFTSSSRNSLLGVMTGEAWFTDRTFPVIGLLVTAAVSAALLHLARRHIARLDF